MHSYLEHHNLSPSCRQHFPEEWTVPAVPELCKLSLLPLPAGWQGREEELDWPHHPEVRGRHQRVPTLRRCSFWLRDLHVFALHYSRSNLSAMPSHSLPSGLILQALCSRHQGLRQVLRSRLVRLVQNRIPLLSRKMRKGLVHVIYLQA